MTPAIFNDLSISDNQIYNVDGGIYVAVGGNGLSVVNNIARGDEMDYFFFPQRVEYYALFAQRFF